jgi:hypothetical protein
MSKAEERKIGYPRQMNTGVYWVASQRPCDSEHWQAPNEFRDQAELQQVLRLDLAENLNVNSVVTLHIVPQPNHGSVAGT